jgi:hypothetical protein
MDDLTQRFAAAHPELQDPLLAAERCFEYSTAFVDLVGAGTVVSGVWMDVEHRIVHAGHAAALIDGVIYDWTARQFDADAPVPLVEPEASWRERWKPLTRPSS